MVEWLKGSEATHLAMEATGNYWMPIYNLLEGHFEYQGERAMFRMPSGSLSCCAMGFWVPASFRRGNKETSES